MNIFKVYSVIKLFTNYKDHTKIILENFHSRFFLLFISEFIVCTGFVISYSQCVYVCEGVWLSVCVYKRIWMVEENQSVFYKETFTLTVG